MKKECKIVVLFVKWSIFIIYYQFSKNNLFQLEIDFKCLHVTMV